MKIIVASTFVPFVEGGGTLIADWLYQKLIEYGREAEIFKIPFYHYPREIIEQMLSIRLFDLSDQCDRLIAIRTPSYMLSHPEKYVWFIHHYRPAVDLWGSPYGMPQNEENIRIRNSIMASDNKYLGESKKLFANSAIVSERLKKFNGLDSEILYPPLMHSEKYFTDYYGDYMFYPSRITSGKRQQSAIEAIKHTKSGVKLIIAGKTETKEWADHLDSIVKENGVSDRVEILDRWISQEEKIKLFSRCLGCVYIPYMEDSYGYVSLESYHSKKPVITFSDAGGTLEVVEDGITGFVTPPDAEELARAMDDLYNNREKSKRMGEKGLEKIMSMNINWDSTIKRLTE